MIKMRKRLKKRWLLGMEKVPIHRQWKAESYLYHIDCYNKEKGDDEDENKG